MKRGLNPFSPVTPERPEKQNKPPPADGGGKPLPPCSVPRCDWTRGFEWQRVRTVSLVHTAQLQVPYMYRAPKIRLAERLTHSSPGHRDHPNTPFHFGPSTPAPVVVSTRQAEDVDVLPLFFSSATSSNTLLSSSRELRSWLGDEKGELSGGCTPAV